MKKIEVLVSVKCLPSSLNTSFCCGNLWEFYTPQFSPFLLVVDLTIRANENDRFLRSHLLSSSICQITFLSFNFVTYLNFAFFFLWIREILFDSSVFLFIRISEICTLSNFQWNFLFFFFFSRGIQLIWPINIFLKNETYLNLLLTYSFPNGKICWEQPLKGQCYHNVRPTTLFKEPLVRVKY